MTKAREEDGAPGGPAGPEGPVRAASYRSAGTRKGPIPRDAKITVREFRAGDEEPLLEAFNRCFAAIDPHFEPRSMEEWQWRYARNPAGWRITVAFDPDGGIIAQQAGMPIHVLHEGRRVTWNQVGDTFVDAEWGRALRKPGLFYSVAQPFSNLYGGPPPDQDPILYGMPTRRAHRIGAAQLGYATVRNQNRLELLPGALAPSRDAGLEVEEVRQVPDGVDPLFERFAAGRGAVAIRDRAWLSWRFLERPSETYTMVAAHRRAPDGSRALAGLAVYRPGAFDGRETGLLCDWFVPPDDGEAVAALLGWLVERARTDGAEHLTAVFPETCPEFAVFQRAGFRVKPTGYYVVGRCYAGPHPMEWVCDHWSYGLGDFDLC